MFNRFLSVTVFAFATAIVLTAYSQSDSQSIGINFGASSQFNTRGNIVIADQFNNRVIEINRKHQVVWQFGNGSSVAGPNSVVGVNDAERFGNLTLIAGTGAPPNTEPTCPTGCPDNRVFIVDQSKRIVWQYGKAGISGSGFNELNTPVAAAYLFNKGMAPGDVLITDQVNERVIEVNMRHQIVWQYGRTGISGAGYNELNNPNSAELLPNGRILIADENNNRVIEVTRGHSIIWQYGSPTNTSILNGAAFASRLPSGDTLITDSLNNRIVQVTLDKEVSWIYRTNVRPGSIAQPNPTRAVRLCNGETLISDQFNHQVIQVNMAKQIVFAQGKIGVLGVKFDELNAPYDAKVIGDFNGLTAP